MSGIEHLDDSVRALTGRGGTVITIAAGAIVQHIHGNPDRQVLAESNRNLTDGIAAALRAGVSP